MNILSSIRVSRGILLFLVMFCSIEIFGQNDTINKRLTEEEIHYKSFMELFPDNSYKHLDLSRKEVIDSLLNAGWYIPNPYLITHKEELILSIYGKPSNDIFVGEWELYSKMGVNCNECYKLKFNSNGKGFIILSNKKKAAFECFSLRLNFNEADSYFGFSSCYCIYIERGDEKELILSTDIDITKIELKEFLQKDGSIIYEVYNNASVLKLRKISN
ncbi:MAG: hypothetical protein H6Q16_647 [Bacteroidetes bacterium]|nr:hypothetical protein [Bacteroidota bacterium]